MCLCTISRSQKPKPEGEGWKVFGLYRDRSAEKAYLRGVYHTGPDISATEWNKTDTEHVIGGGLYRAGWHIFKTEAAAKKMMLDVFQRPYRVVLKVRYRGAHTEGTQWPEATTPDSVVAGEFQIIEGQKLTWQEIQII